MRLNGSTDVLKLRSTNKIREHYDINVRYVLLMVIKEDRVSPSSISGALLHTMKRVTGDGFVYCREQYPFHIASVNVFRSDLLYYHVITDNTDERYQGARFFSLFASIKCERITGMVALYERGGENIARGSRMYEMIPVLRVI